MNDSHHIDSRHGRPGLWAPSPPCPPNQESFESERQLVEQVGALFADRDSDQWVWLPELDSPNGIADLAAAKLCSGWRDSAAIRGLPPRWTYALKCLPYRRSFTLTAFATAVNTSPSCARSVLNLYSQAGFCERNAREKTWTKVSDPHPIVEKIVAVEAKLRDWRKALYQATRYLDYATQSWVVLDRKSLSAAQLHLDEFLRRGIGLIALSPQGDLEVANKARNRMPRMIRRFWHANTEIARRLDESVFQKTPIETI